LINLLSGILHLVPIISVLHCPPKSHSEEHIVNNSQRPQSWFRDICIVVKRKVRTGKKKD